MHIGNDGIQKPHPKRKEVRRLNQCKHLTTITTRTVTALKLAFAKQFSGLIQVLGCTNRTLIPTCFHMNKQVPANQSTRHVQAKEVIYTKSEARSIFKRNGQELNNLTKSRVPGVHHGCNTRSRSSVVFFKIPL